MISESDKRIGAAMYLQCGFESDLFAGSCIFSVMWFCGTF